MSKILRLFADTNYRNLILAEKGFYNWMRDEKYIKMMFNARMGYPLNLEEPKTFNEKLQWLKLYDHNPLYPKLVDKYEVKNYVADLIGDQYIIPTLGVWDRFEDIDFNSLPDQFVLKCTHDSGGLVICKDKDKFDYKVAKRKIEKYMKRNYYYHGREWPYKHVKPRILVEKYMEDGRKELNDYKVHNFPCGPKVILVCRDRFKESGLTEDFYTEDWKHLDIKRENHPNSQNQTERPGKLQEMLELSDRLAKDIPFLRTDFYTIEDKIYFGELTFYPASGFSKFIPNEWDMTFGKWIRIPDSYGGVCPYSR